MVDAKKVKEVNDKIRDLINQVQLYNTEEEEGEGKKVEDDAAAALKGKLQELAQLVGAIK